MFQFLAVIMEWCVSIEMRNGSLLFDQHFVDHVALRFKHDVVTFDNAKEDVYTDISYWSMDNIVIPFGNFFLPILSLMNRL